MIENHEQTEITKKKFLRKNMQNYSSINALEFTYWIELNFTDTFIKYRGVGDTKYGQK